MTQVNLSENKTMHFFFLILKQNNTNMHVLISNLNLVRNINCINKILLQRTYPSTQENIRSHNLNRSSTTINFNPCDGTIIFQNKRRID